MSETSSKDSRKPLKLLSEVLKQRLSPELWSEIWDDESGRPRAKSSKGRTN